MPRTSNPTRVKARKAQILTAALACFQEKGLHGASMQDICAKAGMSPGTVYHYFPSKDDIILHIAAEKRQESQAFAAYLQAAGSLEQGLAATVDAIAGQTAPGDMQVYLELLAEGSRRQDLGAVLTEAEAVATSAILEKLHAEGAALDDGISHKAMAAFMSWQLEMLEILTMQQQDRQAALEMAKVCKRVFRLLLDQRE